MNNVSILHFDRNSVNELTNFLNTEGTLNIVKSATRIIEFSDSDKAGTDLLIVSNKLFDLNLNELIYQMKDSNPKMEFLIVIDSEFKVTLQQSLNGCQSFIDENNMMEELKQWLQYKKDGLNFISPRIGYQFFRLLNFEGRPTGNSRKHKSMNSVTQNVMDLLASGKSYIEIGQKADLSIDMVRYHIKKIYKHFDVKNKVAAINEYKRSKVNQIEFS